MSEPQANKTDSINPNPIYNRTITIPDTVLSALLYELGYRQWLSPNTDLEYAEEAEKICQGLYSAILIEHGQYDQSKPHSAEPDWSALRQARESIFDEYFHCPHLFCLLEHDTPDDMFDAAEVELVAHGHLHDIPPERTEDYISSFANAEAKQ